MSIALFGYGYWGKKLLPLLSDQQEVTVVELKPSSEMSLPTEVLRSAEDVWSDPAITHCLIATPEETHAELVHQALDAKKHVWVEKPLAFTTFQAQELLQTALLTQRCLFLDYTFLYDPTIIYLKSLVDQGLIGQIQHITSTRYTAHPVKSLAATRPAATTVFDDLAPHDIYLFRYFFNTEIKKVEVNEKAVSHGKVTYKAHTTNKLTWEAHYSWEEAQPERTLLLTGETGVVEWQKKGQSNQVRAFRFMTDHKRELLSQTQRNDEKESLPGALADFFRLSMNSGAESPSQQRDRYASYLRDVNVLESVREYHPNRQSLPPTPSIE